MITVTDIIARYREVIGAWQRQLQFGPRTIEAVTFDGSERVELKVVGTETVRELHTMICQTFKAFGPDYMALAFGDKALDDPTLTLNQLKIPPNGVVYVLYEVPKGGLPEGGISSMSVTSSNKVLRPSIKLY